MRMANSFSYLGRGYMTDAVPVTVPGPAALPCALSLSTDVISPPASGARPAPRLWSIVVLLTVTAAPTFCDTTPALPLFELDVFSRSSWAAPPNWDNTQNPLAPLFAAVES